jgi:hypothetical protein
MAWEYKVIRWPYEDFYNDWEESHESEKLMNQLGRDGWELVSVLDAGHSQNASLDDVIAAIFKRPLNR